MSRLRLNTTLLLNLKTQFLNQQLFNTSRNVQLYYSPGLIILNAWYGKFVSETSQKQEKAKVIDVTVPLQCLVKDSKLILMESSKVSVHMKASTIIDHLATLQHVLVTLAPPTE